MCKDCGCPSHNGASYTLVKPQGAPSRQHDHEHDHAHGRAHSHDPETGEVVYHDHVHEDHPHS
ncbi:MAG TPA: hypothetical protein VJ934_02720 [Desulfomicrobiaceae bacterium]|nr:hypothetical protein [Desulfomicrobiaceae bacterium]